MEDVGQGEGVSCKVQVSDEVNPTPGLPSVHWFSFPSSLWRVGEEAPGQWLDGVSQCPGRGEGLLSLGLPHAPPAHPAVTADRVMKGAFLLESGGLS